MCNICNVKSNYRPSQKKHGKHPHVRFVDCVNCGATVQCTINADGSVNEFPYRGGTNMNTFRLNDNEQKEFDELGIQPRHVVLTALKHKKFLFRHNEASHE